jgi:hypothetical protein
MNLINPSEEQEAEWARDRRYHFARFCWIHRNKIAPKSQLTWGHVFERNEGISLHEYARLKMKEKQRNQQENK